MELNKIYNEDCRATLSKMPDNFIDLTVTSLPYDNLRNYDKGQGKAWSFEMFQEIANLLFQKTKQGGVVVWVVNDATVNGSETLTSFKQALYFKEIGFNVHDTMIWEKNGPIPQSHNRYTPCFEYMFCFSKGKPKTFNVLKKKNVTANRGIEYKKHSRMHDKNSLGASLVGKTIRRKKEGYMTNIWRTATGLGGTTNDTIAFEHPAIFPEKLAKMHVHSWSDEGDLVYDCFMGSGTTAKACIELNRNFIGSEISEDYVKIANKRLEPYLNQTKFF